MKQKIRILVLLGLFSFISVKGFSQVSLSYYSSSLSKIGLGYNFNKRLWGEFRLYSDTHLDNVTTELVVCYNIVKKARHNIYVGIGGGAGFFEGVVIPVGLQFTPIKTFKRFSMQIEFEPTLDFESDIIFQSSWGFRYTFGKKD